MFLGAGWLAGWQLGCWLAGWLAGWQAGWLAGWHPLGTLHCTGVVGAAVQVPRVHQDDNASQESEAAVPHHIRGDSTAVTDVYYDGLDHDGCKHYGRSAVARPV